MSTKKAYLITRKKKPKLVVIGNELMAQYHMDNMMDVHFADQCEKAGMKKTPKTTSPLYEKYCDDNKWRFVEVPWSQKLEDDFKEKNDEEE